MNDKSFTERVVSIFGRYKARVIFGASPDAEAALLEDFGIAPRVSSSLRPMRIDCAGGRFLRLVDPELLSASDAELAKFVEKTLG